MLVPADYDVISVRPVQWHGFVPRDDPGSGSVTRSSRRLEEFPSTSHVVATSLSGGAEVNVMSLSSSDTNSALLSSHFAEFTV